MSDFPKVLVILGPTATGKTDLALKLAKKFNGELVACDSRQVYRGLDIGTGKAPAGNFQFSISNFQWVIDGIPVHMYDVTEPTAQYSVADYVTQTTIVVNDILRRDRLPIIVGGTGLYLRGLLEGFSNLAIPVDPKLRSRLEKLALPQLQTKLRKLDPGRWESLNNSERNNPRRLLRHLELTMNGFMVRSNKKQVINNKWEILKIGLSAPRPLLNQRIANRVDSRITQGLIEEGRKLRLQGVTLDRMKALGLEYKYLALHLGGVISKTEMVKQLKFKIHQYAKRQLTWFKRERDVHWFDITEPTWVDQLEKQVQSWYYSANDS